MKPRYDLPWLAQFAAEMAARCWPVFETKAWGCSATEVDWRKHGFEGSRLGYLLNGAGLFHHAHRAVDDCHALLEILSIDLPTTGEPALALLLGTARKPTLRVWAEQSPFDLKDLLKRRGYRGSDGSDGRSKSWVHRRLRDSVRGRDRFPEGDPVAQTIDAVESVGSITSDRGECALHHLGQRVSRTEVERAVDPLLRKSLQCRLPRRSGVRLCKRAWSFRRREDAFCAIVGEEDSLRRDRRLCAHRTSAVNSPTSRPTTVTNRRNPDSSSESSVACFCS